MGSILCFFGLHVWQLRHNREVGGSGGDYEVCNRCGTEKAAYGKPPSTGPAASWIATLAAAGGACDPDTLVVVAVAVLGWAEARRRARRGLPAAVLAVTTDAQADAPRPGCCRSRCCRVRSSPTRGHAGARPAAARPLARLVGPGGHPFCLSTQIPE